MKNESKTFKLYRADPSLWAKLPYDTALKYRAHLAQQAEKPEYIMKSY